MTIVMQPVLTMVVVVVAEAVDVVASEVDVMAAVVAEVVETEDEVAVGVMGVDVAVEGSATPTKRATAATATAADFHTLSRILFLGNLSLRLPD